MLRPYEYLQSQASLLHQHPLFIASKWWIKSENYNFSRWAVFINYLNSKKSFDYIHSKITVNVHGGRKSKHPNVIARTKEFFFPLFFPADLSSKSAGRQPRLHHNQCPFQSSGCLPAHAGAPATFPFGVWGVAHQLLSAKCTHIWIFQYNLMFQLEPQRSRASICEHSSPGVKSQAG